MGEWFRRLIGRPGTVDLGPYRRLLGQVGDREPTVRELPDEELTASVTELRADESVAGADRFPTDKLVEFSALAREAARRALDERPFDVQLLGMMAMLSGNVIEMATGEGKTLVGALTSAGYAIRGRRVHIASVNDYLARRDAEWMRPVYDLLGVSVGWIGQDSTADERRAAYACDVCYGAVSELGFDVLRDRLAYEESELVVPEPDVLIVDEADSVLVDEARVPLVLAGAIEQSAADPALAELVKGLGRGVHYEIEEDARAAHLTNAGIDRVEAALGGIDLYGVEHMATLTAVNLALYAHALVERDVDYIVRDGRIQLIDDNRGRVATLQRWPDGLHAAVEAKEGLVTSESGEVLDTTTIQALVRRYPTVCGMTGTAVAVAEQLREFYELEVAVVPPNVPCIRKDEPDRLYVTRDDKEDALVAHISSVHGEGRPILIGTLDVAESERLARRLRRAGLECSVLNAKNDAEEAAIIAEAGREGAITVSTQMAGRGTDIRLGGRDAQDHDRVAEIGGLYVIGTGRYSSSRLDDQLRGRAGRQGDPGGSVFFTSFEDDVIVRHASDTAVPSADPKTGRIEDAGGKWSMNHAQRVAEGELLELHRNTWRYNKLVEVQRSTVLEYRNKVLHSDLADKELAERCSERHAELLGEVGAEVLAAAARQIVLYHLDQRWSEHFALLTELREGIHLRALGRRNPLDEFNRDAVPPFLNLLAEVREQAAETFRSVTITPEGVDLAASGLKRPTATWTYLVRDDQFDEGERFMSTMKRAMRRPK
ncbi:accessory Sec system translocase SecA2 [Allonocardiopsis opalescens]|nr:accessory Sec system translocase SecA2 [Allonocardiopsis opalescens]